jgi:predicted nucleic acid-binding protein
MPVVLDTSFLVDLEHEVPSATAAWRRLVESGESMHLPIPVFAEYVAGARSPSVAADNLLGAAHLMLMGVAEARAAAALARRAREGGKFPGWNDIFIAACAKEHGDLEIVTGNPAHFPFSRVRTY